jgi:hypothetical protein
MERRAGINRPSAYKKKKKKKKKDDQFKRDRIYSLYGTYGLGQKLIHLRIVDGQTRRKKTATKT